MSSLLAGIVLLSDKPVSRKGPFKCQCDKPAEKRDLGAACNLIQWISTSNSLLGQKYDQQGRLLLTVKNLFLLDSFI